MKIVKTNIANLEESPLLLYKLTKSRCSKSVSKLSDEELDAKYPVEAYCVYEDVNSRGQDVTLLSFLSGDNVFTAQSNTFRISFLEIAEIAEKAGKSFTIEIITGESKSGRRFMDCELYDIA